MNVTRKFQSARTATDKDPESWIYCWLHLSDFLVRQWRLIFALLQLNPRPEPNTASDERTRRVLATLKKNLRVTRLGRSYVQLISYTSLGQKKAANIANAFADAYIEDQLEAKFETTQRASVWLEQRIEELRRQASNAYKAVQDYKSDNNLIVNIKGKLSSETELNKLSEALAKSRAGTTQARARLERIERVLQQRNDNAVPDITDPVVSDALNNAIVTTLRQQFL